MIQMINMVGIRVNNKLDPLLFGKIHVGRIQIQANRKGIDFQKNIMVNRSLADFLKINIVRFSFAKVHSCGVGNHVSGAIPRILPDDVDPIRGGLQ